MLSELRQMNTRGAGRVAAGIFDTTVTSTGRPAGATRRLGSALTFRFLPTRISASPGTLQRTRSPATPRLLWLLLLASRPKDIGLVTVSLGQEASGSTWSKSGRGKPQTAAAPHSPLTTRVPFLPTLLHGGLAILCAFSLTRHGSYAAAQSFKLDIARTSRNVGQSNFENNPIFYTAISWCNLLSPKERAVMTVKVDRSASIFPSHEMSVNIRVNQKIGHRPEISSRLNALRWMFEPHPPPVSSGPAHCTLPRPILVNSSR